jgi:hypothetical protein
MAEFLSWRNQYITINQSLVLMGLEMDGLMGLCEQLAVTGDCQLRRGSVG